jgi:Protein of unknown function (DUF3050)
VNRAADRTCCFRSFRYSPSERPGHKRARHSGVLPGPGDGATYLRSALRQGGHISHFEWYVAGMAEAGADHSVVDRFIDLIRAEAPVPCALEDAGVPRAAAEFVTATWGFIASGPVHCQAAAFAFGREELIPDMFTQVVAVNQDGGGLETFVEYLERHIEVDGDSHTPMAMQMLADLCGEDKGKWRECAQTASAALAARSRLWDGILTAITAERDVAPTRKQLSESAS